MAAKKKILIVDDDAKISKAYSDGLGRAGFEMVLATNGVEAIKQIKKQKPDLILLDIIMPDKNGFEVLEELRMNDDLKNIPAIILSNLGQDSDIKKGKELGAVDYLVKSDFSMKEVVEKVKFYLARKK